MSKTSLHTSLKKLKLSLHNLSKNSRKVYTEQTCVNFANLLQSLHRLAPRCLVFLETTGLQPKILRLRRRGVA